MRISLAPPKRYKDHIKTTRNNRVFNGSYSRYIKLVKSIFPLIAMGLILIVFFWSPLKDLWVNTPKVDPIMPKIAIENYLIEPKFTTTDAKNRPIDIDAEYAIQSFDERTAQLSKPKTRLQIDPKTTVSVASERGTFDETTNEVVYQQSVVLKTSSGYSIQTDEATLSIQKKIAEGRLPVQGQGPAGSFSAEGFRVTDGGKKLELLGKSKLSFNLPQKE